MAEALAIGITQAELAERTGRSQPTISKLACIGDDRRMDYSHANILPSSSETLYELTKVTDESFEV